MLRNETASKLSLFRISVKHQLKILFFPFKNNKYKTLHCVRIRFVINQSVINSLLRDFLMKNS